VFGFLPRVPRVSFGFLRLRFAKSVTQGARPMDTISSAGAWSASTVLTFPEGSFQDGSRDSLAD